MKENKNACDLQRCYLCRHCSTEWIAAIACHRKTFTLRKGQTIFKEGEVMKGMFFVYEGCLKVHKKWDEEKELIVRFAKQGDIVGHRGLGTDLYYPVTATAVENASVCYVDLAFFEASLKVNYNLVHELMMFFAKELKASEKNMRNLAHMPVKGRVITALIRLEEKFGVDAAGAIDVNLTRQDIASLAGTTYETVFRVLTELITERLLTYAGKRIILTDITKLAALAGEKIPGKPVIKMVD